MPSLPIPMPIDPAAEAGELADLFNALSQAVDDFRLGDTLPPGTPLDQLARLKKAAQDLEDVAHGFTAQAIGATLQSIQTDLAKIKAVTADAKTQLGHLNAVSKAISIATAGLNLGTAIAGGNPLTIVAAVEGFGQAVAG